jgi:hypothetical protein
VPVRDRRPDDEQPLVRSVQEQQLIRPPGGAQDASPQADGGWEEAAAEEAGAEQASSGGKGPISQAMDKAQENNWVYDSVANKARETGLLGKADEILNRVRGGRTGG